ncbi:MAG: hypothetical protein LZF60_360071 [Nitrospira sp.]|nr:MAG: hypothetical protein LZF60_360071 [Nitrospira sp.]
MSTDGLTKPGKSWDGTLDRTVWGWYDAKPNVPIHPTHEWKPVSWHSVRDTCPINLLVTAEARRLR